MNNMHLTSLERAAAEKLLARAGDLYQPLLRQLRHSRVSSRKETGTGFVTRLAVDPSEPRAETGEKDVWLRDLEGDIPGLQYGAGFMVLVQNGYISAIEGYSYDEPWPKEIGSFRLYFPESG